MKGSARSRKKVYDGDVEHGEEKLRANVERAHLKHDKQAPLKDLFRRAMLLNSKTA